MVVKQSVAATILYVKVMPRVQLMVLEMLNATAMCHYSPPVLQEIRISYCYYNVSLLFRRMKM